MQQTINEYFETCKKENKDPTAPGLCVALGVSMAQLQRLSGKDKEVRRALYLMADSLEQRHDSNAKFLLRQRIYGGYSDECEKEPVTLRVLLNEEEPSDAAEA